MPVISKIRFTNVIYENGNKRYQDEIFHFDGQNSVILLENGGGKTVWVQTALQAVLPHTEVAGRKAFETFLLSEGCAHIAIEWVVNQKAGIYLVTAVSLYDQSQRLHSYRYAYEYPAGDPDDIEGIPYVETLEGGGKRPLGKAEIHAYYQAMEKRKLKAHTFQAIDKYHEHLAGYGIIAAEWKKIAHINGAEGGVGKFFENCPTTSSLVERLLIPVVEDAISGDGTKNFVESFEKQREHIKKYKQLKAQIDECQRILIQVKGFTTSFEAWDAKDQAFNALKSKAKAVYALIQEEHQGMVAVQEDQRQTQTTIQGAIQTLEQKEASYALQVLAKDVQQTHNHYQEALEGFEKLDQALAQTNHRRTSLEYSQINQLIKDSHQEEEDTRQAIKRLSQDNAVAEIEASLEENSQYLCGYYKNALDQLGKDITRLSNEIQRSQEAVAKGQAEQVGLVRERQNLEQRKTEKQVTIRLIQAELHRLEKSLLDRPDHEDVQTKKSQVQKRLQAVENQIRQGYDTRQQLEAEQETLGQNKQDQAKALDALKEGNRESQNNLDNLEARHQRVIQKIQTASYKWAHIASVYDSHFILTSIERDIEKTRLALEKAKQDERISLRWLDDYEKGEYFIADPRILSRVEEWKKEFDQILTGSEFIQGKKTGNFPYWATTLITTDKERDKLRTYVADNKDYLSHPIWVMTEFEALQYLKDDREIGGEFIFPGPWETNVRKQDFDKWKHQLSHQAQLATLNRQAVEEAHRTWLSLKEAILSFQDQYPQTLFRALNDQIMQYKEDITQAEHTLTAIETREKDITALQAKLIEEKSQLEEEKYSLQAKIRDIISYEQHAREIETNKHELREIIRPKLSKLAPQISRLEKEIQDLKDLLHDLKDALREKNREQAYILDKPLYKEVKNTLPLYGSYSEEGLKTQRQALKKELDQEQKGRSQLESQLSKIIKDRESQKQRLTNHLLQYPSLDKDIRFMTSHQEEIKALIEKGNSLKAKIVPVKEKAEQLKISYQRIDAKYEAQKEAFHKRYTEAFTWEESLSAVKDQLRVEGKALRESLSYIEDQISRTEKDLAETSQVKDLLERKNEAFKYLIDPIIGGELEEDEKLDILYQKAKHIKAIIKDLAQQEQAVATQYAQLLKEKQDFTAFCRNHIRNMKLQELTLRGIENLTTYQGVTQWENNLYNRIMMTRKIAEDDIKTHAEELDLFIHFIHSYVKQVADGLGEIHRKTRVKIEDKWKDVYTIKVPEWDKLEGQEAIQNYILWIIDQLESGKYPQETHRKQIEKWLSVKQLLGIVTQSRPITVKCRKLTNQNTLAPVASSWSQSNKWSGGEKWSKNMILFLGLLNFLAEKTGHVIEGQKRNRTVILDNPFGQASSDHVLSPVFFVADQLGFQIITLTALAEGAFIRKYFPVVYSCRLRTATDGTQIMTKEDQRQQIQQALFKDDKPPSIGTLETKEQLSLLTD